MTIGLGNEETACSGTWDIRGLESATGTINGARYESAALGIRSRVAMGTAIYRSLHTPEPRTPQKVSKRSPWASLFDSFSGPMGLGVPQMGV